METLKEIHNLIYITNKQINSLPKEYVKPTLRLCEIKNCDYQIIIDDVIIAFFNNKLGQLYQINNDTSHTIISLKDLKNQISL